MKFTLCAGFLQWFNTKKLLKPDISGAVSPPTLSPDKCSSAHYCGCTHCWETSLRRDALQNDKENCCFYWFTLHFLVFEISFLWAASVFQSTQHYLEQFEFIQPIQQCSYTLLGISHWQRKTIYFLTHPFLSYNPIAYIIHRIIWIQKYILLAFF